MQDGTLYVRAYDMRVWKQERNTIEAFDDTANTCELCWPTTSDVLARYTLDANHAVKIDLSDFIRLHSTGTQNVYIKTTGGVVNANYTVVGMINPAHMIIPPTRSGALIEPPSVMFRPISVLAAAQIRVEAYSVTDEFTLSGGGAGVTVEPFYPTTFTPAQQHKLIELTMYDEDTDIVTAYRVKQLECDKQYAAVRWTSATGQLRVHTFEVVKVKTATASSYELQDIDNFYNVVKGREDGFVLRLEGLNNYDYWYYSDMIHSSEVWLTLDGVEWQRVGVATKDVTIPDGNAGKTNVLEISVNYRRYDAVSM